MKYLLGASKNDFFKLGFTIPIYALIFELK